MHERNHGMYSTCNCSSIFNIVNTGPLVTHAPLESPPEMLDGVEIRALSGPVVKTSDLMAIFPPPRVRPSMTAGVVLLEHKAPVLFPRKILEPREEVLSQSVHAFFAGVETFLIQIIEQSLPSEEEKSSSLWFDQYSEVLKPTIRFLNQAFDIYIMSSIQPIKVPYMSRQQIS
ncbi:hypothetical protein PHYBLDRAFT_66549 [Phycomyces blakesleeanus NRRL 1555(-)]|uniref:Uncharacterized protein n=1 Tax=Phycomyces blakesleeanus (strain ATCC 8743b / DSM 1359 / FGSC 10004 / NBRC 33097 / NRRL 1555) TaxID=763407 RepID=A0A167LV64_PHYB8|nr:hypothetical protein PHYBLDRAFT_66549 [Phycomyces blakesleeanus NRRL 1555(-)]OAD71159.1 hypothetical protein PHYBLDRAFT_66549 [Phycomyces blakesleeanus NRRL 1555(-)]|eukprot:XP_018289199.1 hypothetical protein PHYBLDRAFT_66549 [Phycomyces blakesleeanus NRRL 1555(-)]